MYVRFRLWTIITCLAISSWYCESLYGQTPKLDSLNRALLTVSNGERHQVLFWLAYEWFDIDNEKAVDFASQAYSLASKNSDSLWVVKSGRIRGQLLRRVNQLEESIHQLEEVLSIAKRNGFSAEEKLILNGLAVSHTYVANYDKALEYNFASLEIREREGDKKQISIALNNIGLVYYKLGDFDRALEFYMRAFNEKSSDDKASNLNLLMNIGLCYNHLGDYQKAKQFIHDAYKICKDDCDQLIQMYGEFGLGIAAYQTQEFDEAEQHFRNALPISREVNDKRYEAETIYYLAKIKNIQKDYDQAADLLLQSAEISKSTGYNESLILAYKGLSNLYSEINDFEKATKYQNAYITLKDSIYSSELIKNLAKVQTNYEERVNLQTIKEKDENIRLQNELISRQRIQYFFVLLITILIIGLASVLVWANRRQQRHNLALSEAKKIIEDQNKELTKSNEELDKRVREKTRDLLDTNDTLIQVNEELDNFIYKTSHDIRGPLVTLKGVCNVASLDVKDPVALDYLKRLDLTAEKLNSILTRLLVVNQINHQELEAVLLNLAELIQELLLAERKTPIPSRMKITSHVDPQVSLISDRYLIRIILENLIDNAIKFYNTSERIEPFVNIQISVATPSKILIQVEDNGIGITTPDKDGIFHLFARASERSETGGIGLYLTRLATQRLGGEVRLVQTSDKGSTFHVFLPADLRPILEKRKQAEAQMKSERAKRDRELKAQREQEEFLSQFKLPKQKGAAT